MLTVIRKALLENIANKSKRFDGLNVGLNQALRLKR